MTVYHVLTTYAYCIQCNWNRIPDTPPPPPLPGMTLIRHSPPGMPYGFVRFFILFLFYFLFFRRQGFRMITFDRQAGPLQNFNRSHVMVIGRSVSFSDPSRGAPQNPPPPKKNFSTVFFCVLRLQEDVFCEKICQLLKTSTPPPFYVSIFGICSFVNVYVHTKAQVCVYVHTVHVFEKHAIIAVMFIVIAGDPHRRKWCTCRNCGQQRFECDPITNECDCIHCNCGRNMFLTYM